MGDTYTVSILKELLKKYVEDGDDSARLKISNQIINGRDLCYALLDVRKSYLELIEKNEKLIEESHELIGESEEAEQSEKIKKLFISDLEKIIDKKGGTIVKEIRNVIQKYR